MRPGNLYFLDAFLTALRALHPRLYLGLQGRFVRAPWHDRLMSTAALDEEKTHRRQNSIRAKVFSRKIALGLCRLQR